MFLTSMSGEKQVPQVFPKMLDWLLHGGKGQGKGEKTPA